MLIFRIMMTTVWIKSTEEEEIDDPNYDDRNVENNQLKKNHLLKMK